jgi:hypothetical protein
LSETLAAHADQADVDSIGRGVRSQQATWQDQGSDSAGTKLPGGLDKAPPVASTHLPEITGFIHHWQILAAGPVR